jgi:hypothetical protein
MEHNKYIHRARTSGEAARLRRRSREQMEEITAFCSGGILVLTGLMLAVLVCLCRHQVQA